MKRSDAWLFIGTAVLILAASFLLTGGAPQDSLSAQVRTEVGYVDWDLILSAYAGDAIAAVLAERDRLQEEFDRQAPGLEEDARLALFQEYERRLADFEREMEIDRLMSDIDQAMSAVAAEAGVTVIVDRGAVVWGGVDLTGAVLRRLGVAE